MGKSDKTTRRDILKGGAVTLAGLGLRLDRVTYAQEETNRLAADFLRPPDNARPWVYWYFMDGHLTREGMRADLEAMQRAGIGGAIYLEVGLGIAPGPVKFMSLAWQELVAAAFQYADQLGIEIALAAGPGWCGAGGPWVKPEESMQFLIAGETKVTGPARFDAILSRPKPRTPFFGEGTLTPELRREWLDFYKDEFVLAFPSRADGPRIEDIDEKALYTRGSYSSQILGPYMERAWVRPFLPSPDAAQNGLDGIATDHVVDLAKDMSADGTLRWDVPEGEWTILRMGRSITAQTTRPAPLPGIGLETDKFSRAAIDAHLQHYLEPLLARIGTVGKRGRGLTTLHFDSWEMGSQNWSEGFEKEFARRRGYDMLRFLPTFSGHIAGTSEMTERFLWDFRQTAQELVIENQITRLRDFGKSHGLMLSMEMYDLNPCSDLPLAAPADVPMGEFWSKDYGIDSDYSIVEATSAGHTYGRRIIGAESFTASRTDLWKQHPASMKEQGDWALCAGINRIVFHRFQAQPDSTHVPGMTMGLGGGYGVHWDRTQTWWDLVPAFHLYLSRCQHMLRQGHFVADFLYLVPEGAPNVFTPPPTAFLPGKMSDRRGYNFDGCSPDALIGRASTLDGRIVFPDGMSYALLVLPRVGSMTPPLLRKIVDLVEAGASVLGTPPRMSPSLTGFPRCDEEVKALSMRLWGDGRAPSMRRVGHGRVWTDGQAPRSTDANPLKHALWIWTKPSSIGSPDRAFGRSFDLPAAKKVTFAELTITASPGFDAHLNGLKIASGHAWERVRRVEVTASLAAGSNELRVVVSTNAHAHGPYGLLAALHLVYDDGTTESIATGPDWFAREPHTSTDEPVSVLGAFDAAPWKLTAKNLEEVTLYSSYESSAGILRQLGIPPDIEAGNDVRCIHRRIGSSDLYFIGNRRAETIQTTCIFRVAGRQPEWWNPLTGERRALPEFQEKDGRTHIPFRLEPGESGFVFFSHPAPKANPRGGNALIAVPVQTIDGPWEVHFDTSRGGPDRHTFHTLEDWTAQADPGIKFYSGQAIYRTHFSFGHAAPADRMAIQLGEVRNIASVRLNGRELGIAWCAPWRVELPPDALRQGENLLEIEVANLWTNRLIGDSALPVEQRVTWEPGTNPLTPQDALQPSGLLGPVTIARLNVTKAGQSL